MKTEFIYIITINICFYNWFCIGFNLVKILLKFMTFFDWLQKFIIQLDIRKNNQVFTRLLNENASYLFTVEKRQIN